MFPFHPNLLSRCHRQLPQQHIFIQSHWLQACVDPDYRKRKQKKILRLASTFPDQAGSVQHHCRQLDALVRKYSNKKTENRFLNNLRLTLDTVAKAKNDQNQLYDVNGNLEHLARWQVNLLIIIGWVSYIISLILTVIYYAIHPSAPMKTLDTKLVVHVFGRRWDLRNCSCRRHGEF